MSINETLETLTETEEVKFAMHHVEGLSRHLNKIMVHNKIGHQRVEKLIESRRELRQTARRLRSELEEMSALVRNLESEILSLSDELQLMLEKNANLSDTNVHLGRKLLRWKARANELEEGLQHTGSKNRPSPQSVPRMPPDVHHE
mmetsp:Transcript_21255/g.32119  ORF Transcript_21255/g.32119 Transcript_21255/m.32119 type:complete len:146 (+) Transcript_21255:208-645(+)|eukprot:scaffold2871_cov103-Skeletonema_dohrnii-CCMP3373.AAC.4